MERKSTVRPSLGLYPLFRARSEFCVTFKRPLHHQVTLPGIVGINSGCHVSLLWLSVYSLRHVSSIAGEDQNIVRQVLSDSEQVKQFQSDKVAQPAYPP